ncbi:MAG: hypothetical protein HY898_07710 [Deltaproteobacteria bacterium]|nr:hypothetical protein [Deltaproteobacteria bacterium]
MTERVDTPATADAPSTASEVGRLIRPVAALGLVALVLGRVVAPALKGSFNGIDKFIWYADKLAGVTSQGLAFAVTALAIGALLVVARDNRVSLFVRALLVPQTVLVLFLGIWATRKALPNPGAILVGLMASVAAIIGAIQGMLQPRTRAVAVVLAVTGLAGLLHVASGTVMLRPGTMPVIAAALSSLAVLVHGIALLVALVWLATRRRTIIPPATMGALAVSVLLTWAAARGAQTPSANGWAFVWRALETLLPSPASGLPVAMGMFLAVLSPSLAVAALATRRQIPSVIGALTLTLLAGVLVDAPVQAMILTLASLSTVLASRDERGMWEALIGRPLRPGGSKPPG